MTICMIICTGTAATIEVTAELLYCHCHCHTARVIACLLSRRFIILYNLYSYSYHNASIGPPLHLGIRPCYHSRLLLYVYLILPSRHSQGVGTQLTYSIRHFPNSLIPFNPFDDLQTPLYWYTSIIRYRMLQSIRNPKGGCCVYQESICG